MARHCEEFQGRRCVAFPGGHGVSGRGRDPSAEFNRLTTFCPLPDESVRKAPFRIPNPREATQCDETAVVSIGFQRGAQIRVTQALAHFCLDFHFGQGICYCSMIEKKFCSSRGFPTVSTTKLRRGAALAATSAGAPCWARFFRRSEDLP